MPLPNEIVLIASLILSFGCLVAVFRLWGAAGCYAYIALSSVLANIEVLVLINAFSMEQTLGNTLFAASFLATDILSEMYGKDAAKKGVGVGISAVVVFMLFSFTWRLYTPSEHDSAYPLLRSLFSSTPRVLVASLAGYAISGALDVKLYHILMNCAPNKMWLRNNAATLISQLVNIIIFNFGAFSGAYPLKTLASMTASCYIIYIATSLLDTPFLYLAKHIKAR